jgi:hypothetical protein
MNVGIGNKAEKFISGNTYSKSDFWYNATTYQRHAPMYSNVTNIKQ